MPFDVTAAAVAKFDIYQNTEGEGSALPPNLCNHSNL